MSLFPSPFPTTTFQPFYPKLAMEPPPLQVTPIRPKPIGVPKWHRSCPTLQPSATPPSSSHQALTPSRAWHRDNPPQGLSPPGDNPPWVLPKHLLWGPPRQNHTGHTHDPKSHLEGRPAGLAASQPTTALHKHTTKNKETHPKSEMPSSFLTPHALGSCYQPRGPWLVSSRKTQWD